MDKFINNASTSNNMMTHSVAGNGNDGGQNPASHTNDDPNAAKTCKFITDLEELTFGDLENATFEDIEMLPFIIKPDASSEKTADESASTLPSEPALPNPQEQSTSDTTNVPSVSISSVQNNCRNLESPCSSYSNQSDCPRQSPQIVPPVRFSLAMAKQKLKGCFAGLSKPKSLDRKSRQSRLSECSTDSGVHEDLSSVQSSQVPMRDDDLSSDTSVRASSSMGEPLNKIPRTESPVPHCSSQSDSQDIGPSERRSRPNSRNRMPILATILSSGTRKPDECDNEGRRSNPAFEQTIVPETVSPAPSEIVQPRTSILQECLTRPRQDIGIFGLLEDLNPNPNDTDIEKEPTPEQESESGIPKIVSVCSLAPGAQPSNDDELSEGEIRQIDQSIDSEPEEKFVCDRLLTNQQLETTKTTSLDKNVGIFTFMNPLATRFHLDAQEVLNKTGASQKQKRNRKRNTDSKSRNIEQFMFESENQSHMDDATHESGEPSGETEHLEVSDQQHKSLPEKPGGVSGPSILKSILSFSDKVRTKQIETSHAHSHNSAPPTSAPAPPLKVPHKPVLDSRADLTKSLHGNKRTEMGIFNLMKNLNSSGPQIDTLDSESSSRVQESSKLIKDSVRSIHQDLKTPNDFEGFKLGQSSSAGTRPARERSFVEALNPCTSSSLDSTVQEMDTRRPPGPIVTSNPSSILNQLLSRRLFQESSQGRNSPEPVRDPEPEPRSPAATPFSGSESPNEDATIDGSEMEELEDDIGDDIEEEDYIGDEVGREEEAGDEINKVEGAEKEVDAEEAFTVEVDDVDKTGEDTVADDDDVTGPGPSNETDLGDDAAPSSETEIEDAIDDVDPSSETEIEDEINDVEPSSCETEIEDEGAPEDELVTEKEAVAEVDDDSTEVDPEDNVDLENGGDPCPSVEVDPKTDSPEIAGDTDNVYEDDDDVNPYNNDVIQQNVTESDPVTPTIIRETTPAQVPSRTPTPQPSCSTIIKEEIQENNGVSADKDTNPNSTEQHQESEEKLDEKDENPQTTIPDSATSEKVQETTDDTSQFSRVSHFYKYKNSLNDTTLDEDDINPYKSNYIEQRFELELTGVEKEKPRRRAPGFNVLTYTASGELQQKMVIREYEVTQRLQKQITAADRRLVRALAGTVKPKPKLPIVTTPPRLKPPKPVAQDILATAMRQTLASEPSLVIMAGKGGPSVTGPPPLRGRPPGRPAVPKPPREDVHPVVNKVASDISKCIVCDKTFLLKAQLTAHMRKEHSDQNLSEEFKCRICHQLFPKLKNLRTHMRSHIGKDGYRCQECNLRFAHSWELSRHSSVHSGENLVEAQSMLQRALLRNKLIYCPKCDHGFDSKTLYKDHMRHHEIKEKVGGYCCFVCAKTLNSQKALVQHRLQHYCLLRCHLCSETFKRYHLLQTHMKWQHGGESFLCQHCGKSLKNAHLFKQHSIKAHQDKIPFKCNLCGKKFGCQGKLATHVSRHTGQGAIQCPFCPNHYAQVNAIKLHIHKMHWQAFQQNLRNGKKTKKKVVNDPIDPEVELANAPSALVGNSSEEGSERPEVDPEEPEMDDEDDDDDEPNEDAEMSDDDIIDDIVNATENNQQGYAVNSNHQKNLTANINEQPNDNVNLNNFDDDDDDLPMLDPNLLVVPPEMLQYLKAVH